MTKRRSVFDENLVLGKLLARVDQLEKDVDQLSNLISRSFWALLALTLGIIVYFWHHPKAWSRLVELLR